MHVDNIEQRVKSLQTRCKRLTPNDHFALDIFNMESENVERSFTGMNGTYLFSRLMLEIILDLPFASKDFAESVLNIGNWFGKDSPYFMQLGKFNANYNKEDVFEWYTRESFFYRILNKSLRAQAPDNVFLCRSYIKDLSEKIRENRCSDPVVVYRAQLLSTVELDRLENSKGQFISINPFFRQVVISL